MPRKGYVVRRDVLANPVYSSKLVTRLVNRIIINGKRGITQKILYNAFDIIEVKINERPVEVFEKVLGNVMPLLELRVCRVGDTNHQIPVEVSTKRHLALGLRWIVNYTRLRGEKTMEQRLAIEIMDTANGSDTSVRKHEDTYKMAEANETFAHYRW